MAGGQWNGMGSVALSLVPTWKSSEEGAAAPTWTCPAREASGAPNHCPGLPGAPRWSLPPRMDAGSSLSCLSHRE